MALAKPLNEVSVRCIWEYAGGAGLAPPAETGTQGFFCDFFRFGWLVVVVLVPIAIGVPAVVVFIPPAMLLTPATLARVVQFTTLVICLSAVASMALDGLVEFMLCVDDSTLTAVDVFGVKSRHSAEKQGCGQDGA